MSEHDHHEIHKHNEHVHDENCACGLDHHEHTEHVHHENCGCDAEKKEALGVIHVESHLHDEARVISGSLTLFANYDKLKPVLSEQLEILAKTVQERGGIVGHIKASVETKRVEMFSVTDVAVSVKTVPGEEIRISLAAIVFAINPDEATMLVKSALEAAKASV